MIDFADIEKYKENNRIEVKKASGGLPRSIWETYSAFANTFGGIILLGVEEYTDKFLRPVGVSNPEKIIKDFWDTIHNMNKVSINILSDKDVTAEEINGKYVVVIHVPRALRGDKPIYIDGNPLSGSYRRNGEGDYKCTKDEVQAMMRDASVKTQDMVVLEESGLDVFDYDSIKRYRIRMKNYRPGHVWEELEDSEFLYKLGVVGRSSNGTFHPTAAGLLMFGKEYEIVKEYPAYFLDYQEQMDLNTRWTDRIVSSSGDWSGNLYDFYFRVYNKITQDIKVPFKLDGGDRIDDTPVHSALREALANCLVNADYYGRQGLVIIKRRNGITFSNPGGFRIDVEAAKSGGISDPRNSTLMKLFNLIDIGERAGSGIPNIFSIWKKQGWPDPVINENFEPDRITLSLLIDESCDKKVAIKSGDKKAAIKSGDKSAKTKSYIQKQFIVDHLTEKMTAKASDIAELLAVKNSRARYLLAEMVTEGTLIAEGKNRNRVYKLKE